MGTLLVVDDSRTIRQAVQMTFQNTGIQVLEADNVPQGLDILRQQKPDMVLVDLVIQGDAEAGFSFAEQALSGSQTGRIPIFILSGKNRNVDKKRAKLIGAKVFIKPFDTQDLIDLAELTIAESDQKQSSAPAPGSPTQNAMEAASAPRMTMQMSAFNPDAIAAPADPFGVPAAPKPTASIPAAAPMPDPFAAPPQQAPAADPFAAAPQQTPAADPFAAPPQQAPAADPFAAAPQQAPAADPFAAAPQQAPADDPFASAPQQAPAADPFAAAPQQAPTADPFAAAPQQAPAEDPFAAAPQQAPAADPFAAAPQQAPAEDPFAAAPQADPVEMDGDDLEIMDDLEEIEEVEAIEPELEQTNTPVEFDEGDLDLIEDDLEEPDYQDMVTTDDVVAEAAPAADPFAEDDPFGPLPDPPSTQKAEPIADPFAGLDQAPIEEPPLEVAPKDSPKDPFAGLADPGFDDEPLETHAKAPNDPFAGLNEPEPEPEIPEVEAEPEELDAVELEEEPAEAMEIEQIDPEPIPDIDLEPGPDAELEVEALPELESVDLDEDAAEPIPTESEQPVPNVPIPTPEPVDVPEQSAPLEVESQSMAEAQFFATQTQTVKAPVLTDPKAQPVEPVPAEPIQESASDALEYESPVRITDASLEAHGDGDNGDFVDAAQIMALMRKVLREEQAQAPAMAAQAASAPSAGVDMNELRDVVRSVVRDEMKANQTAPAAQAVDTVALSAALSQTVKAELAKMPAPQAAAPVASDKLSDGQMRTIVKVVAETVHSVVQGEMTNALAKLPAPSASAGGGGGADLTTIRQAIQEEIGQLMSQKIEAIAWEVVPKMAETILKRVIAKQQQG